MNSRRRRLEFRGQGLRGECPACYPQWRRVLVLHQPPRSYLPSSTRSCPPALPPVAMQNCVTKFFSTNLHSFKKKSKTKTKTDIIMTVYTGIQILTVSERKFSILFCMKDSLKMALTEGLSLGTCFRHESTRLRISLV